MSIETIGFIDKNINGLNEIFTSTMKINVFQDKNKIVKLVINNGTATIIFKNIASKFKGGKKQNYKNKTKKRRKKTMKGGNPLLKKLLMLIFLFFTFNYIISVQIHHREGNRLTEEEWQSGLSMIDHVKTINFTNSTSLNLPQIIQLFDMDGENMEIDNINLPTNSITAFAEIDFPEDSATKTIARELSQIPFKKRPILGFGSNNNYYEIFAEWEIINDNTQEINVELFDVLNSDGEHPDSRARNLPDNQNINELAKQSLKEQINTMKKTNLLTNNETKGFASLIMVNFAVHPSLIGNTDGLWHQDGMPHLISRATIDNDDNIGTNSNVSLSQAQRALGNILLSNTTMSRLINHDHIITFTYEPNVAETNARIAFQNLDGETKITNIQTTQGQSHTQMINQKSGRGQHQTLTPPMLIASNRNALLTNVMPNVNQTFYKDPDKTFRQRQTFSRRE